MSDDTRLLEEIRDLLREQNRLIASVKETNEAAARKNADYMAKAEEMGRASLAQNTAALKGTGWLKWGLWIFLGLLLLMFAAPTPWGFFR